MLPFLEENDVSFAFNSLSRDHFMARVKRIKNIIDLSTPSLGITESRFMT